MSDLLGLRNIKDKSVNVTEMPISRYGTVDVINLKNICQSYQMKDGSEKVVFDNFNLEIKDVLDAGQFVVIIGASGCGKSTILRYIAGLQRPDSGEIYINDVLQTENHRIGMVFQQYSSLPWRTVLQNVTLPLEMQKVPKKEAIERAKEIIAMVGLAGHEDKFAQYPILSGGQLQRVAIARNIVTSNEILLMDEPFGALDIKTRLQMQNLLSDIWCKMPGDPSVLFVTHDLQEAVYLADEIVILDANPCSIVKTIHIDLPQNRDKSIKRCSEFINYVNEIEDVMMSIEHSNH